MKALILSLIAFALFNFTGLSQAAAAGPETKETVIQADSKKSAKTDGEKSSEKPSLQISSEKLALQMVEGKFDDTYKKLAPVAKKSLTKSKLKQGWNDTVQGLGKFVAVHSGSYMDYDDYKLVELLLQYEYNGVQISFTYDNKEQITGLYFSYRPIEEEAVETKDFKEVKISIGKGKYPLKAILTLPKQVKKAPVAILVPGSGNHDANETIIANRVFRDLAWGLAKKGIASIRYNERLFTYPELLTEAEFTIQTDCLNDAADAISYALSSKEVDNSRVYLIGHSLGGMMAPKIATDNPGLAGIVILAGSPRRLEDIIYDQNLNALKNTEGITEMQIQLSMKLIENMIKRVKGLKESGTEAILGYPASYWYSLNQIDTAELAGKLTIPIFIAQGSADFQIYADKDYVEWQKLLKKNKNVSFKLYDGLNHLFMKSNGKKDITEYNVPGEVDAGLINDIAAWIKKKK